MPSCFLLFLLIVAFLFVLLLLLVVFLEGVGRDGVDAHDGLVRVPHQNVLAVLEREELVREHLDDPPNVGQLQRDVGREVGRLVELRRQDHVVVLVGPLGPAHEADLDLVRPRHHRLRDPLGQLARVVLELGGQHGAALDVDLLPPLDPAREVGVELVEGEGGHVLLAALLGADAVQLAPGHHAHGRLPAKRELAVPVGHRGWGHARGGLVRVEEGVGLGELLALGLRRVRQVARVLEDLLGEVLVDGARLEGEVVW
mmetsp:Transcript_11894/g.27886  ORF Transcript_11894/g.27886 Transcript_11894/m.27886 type:complete len:257 (+) Transcript_11894:215-985(+)